MANTNNFKAFALDPNANVMSQADWEGLPALLSGFTAGKASSAQVNKAIRQATTIGALVGQFIANSGVDALDNGDVAGLVTKFTNAITTNLSLGTAATRNVGTAANQIPSMASWTTGTNGNGTWVKQPNGFIIQTGYIVGQSSGGVTITFPTAFTTAPSYSLIATSATNVTAIATSSSAASINNARVFNTAGAQTSNGIQWMAMGF